MAVSRAASLLLLLAAPTSILGNESRGPTTANRIQPEAIERPTLFTRSNYVWPFVTGPTYGLKNVPPDIWSRPGMFHTAVGSFDLTRALPNFPAELETTVKTGELEAQYFVLSLHTDTLGDGRHDRLRDLIEAEGGELMESMAVGGFIVRLNPTSYGIIQEQPGVIALMPYHPALKLSPILGRAPLPDAAEAISEVYKLRVSLFPGEDPATVAEAIADLGGNVTATWPGTVKVELHRQLLPALAALEPVKMIHEDLPVYPTAEETTATMQAGQCNGGGPCLVPYLDAGADGGGGSIATPQVLMIIDTGIQIDAGDLSDTKTLSGTPGALHRKVRFYGTTNPFGGSGDDQGCDATTSGGLTHGHTVAATALGWATDVLPGYIDDGSGKGYEAIDADGNPWKLDGVAPRAVLVAYDAQVTPATLSCDDPMAGGLSLGLLYSPGHAGGSMEEGYHTHDARVFNFSFGSPSAQGIYGPDAGSVDAFLFEHRDAMVFVSAGNEANDTNFNGVPDPGSVQDPATCKSCISMGASGNVNGTGLGANRRAFFSSVGPATPISGRIAPLLMAPGTDFGISEFHCRSNDNDQSGPVECDLVSGLDGTSLASAAAAGAGLLIRDYFAQGFYPDATTADAGNSVDQFPNISGALVKALMVAGADFMTGANLSEGFRFNNEQGYGRIQLDNVLHLTTWSTSPTGLIVADGGIAGGPNNTMLSGTATNGVTETHTFAVDDDTQELRVACAWIEDSGETLANDIDIELVAPDGTTTYFGNFFSEDRNPFNDILDAGEDCDADGEIDEGGWSIPTNTCTAAAPHDPRNPTEAIMLSPDPAGDGIEDDPLTPVDESADNQIQVGDWTLKVAGATIVAAGGQDYACVLAGSVALGSSVRFKVGRFVCNDLTSITVNETDPTQDGDTDLDTAVDKAAEVSSRLTVQVLDAADTVLDEETGITFSRPDPLALRFVSNELLLTDGTARSAGATFGNGVLDIRSGERLKAIYADETLGSPDPDKERSNTATVDCEVSVGLGGIFWAQFGRDTSVLIDGGCERNARGKFTFGFPDRYMDAGELLGYRIAFQSAEPEVDLRSMEVSLRCVRADADSPAGCLPGTNACSDPDRENNPACSELVVLDSPKTIGLLPAGAAVSVNFTLEMADSIPGTPKIEMVAGITARTSGKTAEGVVVSRHVLDVDEKSLFYSTDFPEGGVEIRDFINDEVAQSPTTSLDADKDFRFESRTWSSLTATGRNLTIQSPWSFDASDGGFTVGLHSSTDASLSSQPANWGEDKNFNNLLDPGEDRNPINGQLDNNWSTLGGCGWQTKSAGADTGGVWHTGRIDATTIPRCTSSTGLTAKCHFYERAGFGIAQERFWMELLKTPELEKVNQDVDAEGEPVYTVEFINWAWNASLDLADDRALLTWELDNDTAAISPSNLDAFPVLGLLAGNFGAVSGGNSSLTGGFPVFAPEVNQNGTVGNNREGSNTCFFDFPLLGPLHLAEPADDDLDNDGDAVIDEFVEPSGPIRNFDISLANGPDMRFVTLEDTLGDSGNSFQGALGFLVIEGTTIPPQPGFGAAVDDMVVQWREFRLVKDTTECDPAGGGGSCASIEIETTNVYEGSAVLGLRVLDRFPYDPVNPKNDCDLDGSFTGPGDDTDCNDNGIADIVVKAFSESGDVELVALDLTPTSGVYEGSISISTAHDVPGVLFLEAVHPPLLGGIIGDPTVRVQYDDRDDGTGSRCPNSVDPNVEGTIEAVTTVFITGGNVVVKGWRITSDPGLGDGDPFADTNETVNMFLTLSNKTGLDLNAVVVRISTDDPKIDCILKPFALVGSLLEGETRETAEPFVFKVAFGANRVDPFEDFSATFTVTLSSDVIDSLLRPQEVTLDLDLDVSGGGTPATFLEGFEVNNGFGGFTGMPLDDNKSSLALSDGHRCQYNDPDNPGSNSFGNPDCFLGFPVKADNGFDWHVHKASGGQAAPDGGRAFAGTRSLHWGKHSTLPSEDSTRFKQLEAIRTTDPIALGWDGVSPELSFKHQVSFMDYRVSRAQFGTSLDRGVVQIQLIDAGGNPVGSWMKISPYQSIYDVQGNDEFANCMFDPIDDGSTEDDFFDPTDPNRRLGPSSTCFPEFVFGFHGDTDYRNTFNEQNIGRSSDGPGLQGSIDRGTWIETRFDLSRWIGRRILLRFLATSIEIAGNVDYRSAGFDPDIVEDDGWYIDELQISDTLTAPATVTVDNDALTGIPCSGVTCNMVTPSLVATPSSLAAPGQVTSLDASASFADICVDGVLQFQFWIDGDGNSVLGDPADTLLRDFTDNPLFVDAPGTTTAYGVKARCSSAPATCTGDATLTVTVTCPSLGTVGPFSETLLFADKDTLSWSSVQDVDAIRGDLGALRSTGDFSGTVEACVADNVSTASISAGSALAPGSGLYYLVRTANFCNANATWASGGIDAGDRDGQISADPNRCP